MIFDYGNAKQSRVTLVQEVGHKTRIHNPVSESSRRLSHPYRRYGCIGRNCIRPDPPKDLIHYFTTCQAQLEYNIRSLRNEIKENGTIWISWPKTTANLETDLNENIIRNIALSNGLVDVKICAVNEIWSGLKLVIPLKNRKS